MTARAASKTPRTPPLEVYRIGHRSAGTVIVDHAYGSTLQDGRWHAVAPGGIPRRVIYAASSRALAQLEKRVHANGVQPINQASYVLTLPAGLVIRNAYESGLPERWRNDLSSTQAFGNAWLDAGDELALWVPSVVEPAEQNLLLNANHPHIDHVIVLVEREPFEFDPRLM